MAGLIETAHLLRSPRNAARGPKPEPLKHGAAGAWSRRLSQEHRIVYLVRQDRAYLLQARYHY